MSKRLPKIIRRDARVLKAIEFEDGVTIYFEDMRPKAPWVRSHA